MTRVRLIPLSTTRWDAKSPCALVWLSETGACHHPGVTAVSIRYKWVPRNAMKGFAYLDMLDLAPHAVTARIFVDELIIGDFSVVNRSAE